MGPHGIPVTTYSTTYINSRILNPINPQLTLLLNAANKNLKTQDYPNGASRCTRAQLFGEYLHTYEDTFGHRDQVNKTIGVNGGAGHFQYGHEADKTYNDTVTGAPLLFPLANGVWNTRESRTLEMERAVFNKIQAQYGTQAKDKNGFPIQFGDIEASLKTFNNFQEDEATTPLFPQKLQLLDSILVNYGFAPIPRYKIVDACNNRRLYTQGLKATDYPGVILGTSNGPCPVNRPH